MSFRRLTVRDNNLNRLAVNCVDPKLTLRNYGCYDTALITHNMLGTVNYLKTLISQHDIKVIGITGASGSGKDTFADLIINSQYNVAHYRFGDVMKDLAYELGMVKYPKSAYEANRELRFEELPNGKTALEAWTALDVIREYNPFVFVGATLSKIIKDLEQNKPDIIIFSGSRTEAGLRTVDSLADLTIKMNREGNQKVLPLDELQVRWTTDEVVQNNGSIDDLRLQANGLLFNLMLS